MKEELKRYIPTLVVLALALRFFVPGLIETTDTLIAPEKKVVETPEVTKVNPFFGLELEAEAAHVVDLVTGEVLYAKDAEVQLPLASLTKLMTILVALENIDPIQAVAIGSHSIQQNGSNGLVLGERWRVKDLVDFTLVSSSNDGADALASAAASSMGAPDIIDQLNSKAEAIGLEQTYFLNGTGLDVSEKSLAGAYGSAQDVSKTVAYILQTKPDALEATQESSVSVVSLDSRIHNANNTNTNLANMPWVIASKTGFTELAGGNLTVAFDAGPAHPVVATVLGSTIDGRFTDVEKLISTTFEYLASNNQ